MHAPTGPTTADSFLNLSTKNVYVNKPQTFNKENGVMPQDTLHKVMENALKRADFCVQENGSLLTNVVFNT